MNLFKLTFKATNIKPSNNINYFLHVIGISIKLNYYFDFKNTKSLQKD